MYGGGVIAVKLFDIMTRSSEKNKGMFKLSIGSVCLKSIHSSILSEHNAEIICFTHGENNYCDP